MSSHMRMPLAVYLLIAFLLMCPLLGPGYYIVLDLAFGPGSFADFQFDNLYGMPSPNGGHLPVRLALAALSELLPVEVVEKLLLFALLFMCGACMHLSLPQELGNSRYFAGLLYMLNPFVFVRFIVGHWFVLLSYALWPIAIKQFWDFMKKPDSGNLAKAVLLTTAASVSSHGVFLLLIAYALIFIISVLQSRSRMHLLRQTAILALLVLAMNLFWILPTLLSFSSTYSLASPSAYMEDFGATGSADLPLPLAVLTMHGFWRGGIAYTKDIFGGWFLVFLFLLSVSVAGLVSIMRRDRSYGLFLSALFLLAFLLSLGDNGPLAGLFTLGGKQFPLYFFFRDSQKIVGLLAFVYSVAGAYGVQSLAGDSAGWKKSLALVALLSLPVLYNYGFFGFLGQVGPTQYPDDWVQAGRIIAADPTPSKILVLPSYLYLEHPWLNGAQKTVGYLPGQFFTKPVIAAMRTDTVHVSSDINDPGSAYLDYLFLNRASIADNRSAELLLPLCARYIVVLKGYPESIHSLFLFLNQSRQPREHLELAYEGPDLYLFRNNLVKGPFFASKDDGNGSATDLFNLSGNGLYSPDVSYEKITSVSYRVLSSPYPYLVLARGPNPFMRFNGLASFPWHGIATAFAYSGPGTVQSVLFPLAVALLLISWLVGFWLLSGIRNVLVLAAAAILIYVLVINGIMAPWMLGALLVFTVLAAAAFRFTKIPRLVISDV